MQENVGTARTAVGVSLPLSCIGCCDESELAERVLTMGTALVFTVRFEDGGLLNICREKLVVGICKGNCGRRVWKRKREGTSRGSKVNIL